MTMHCGLVKGRQFAAAIAAVLTNFWTGGPSMFVNIPIDN